MSAAPDTDPDLSESGAASETRERTCDRTTSLAMRRRSRKKAKSGESVADLCNVRHQKSEKQIRKFTSGSEVVSEWCPRLDREGLHSNPDIRNFKMLRKKLFYRQYFV